MGLNARIAQSVEHQTFNLRVQGSSPCSGELPFCTLLTHPTRLPSTLLQSTIVSYTTRRNVVVVVVVVVVVILEGATPATTHAYIYQLPSSTIYLLFLSFHFS